MELLPWQVLGTVSALTNSNYTFSALDTQNTVAYNNGTSYQYTILSSGKIQKVVNPSINGFSYQYLEDDGTTTDLGKYLTLNGLAHIPTGKVNDYLFNNVGQVYSYLDPDYLAGFLGGVYEFSNSYTPAVVVSTNQYCDQNGFHSGVQFNGQAMDVNYIRNDRGGSQRTGVYTSDSQWDQAGSQALIESLKKFGYNSMSPYPSFCTEKALGNNQYTAALQDTLYIGHGQTQGVAGYEAVAYESGQILYRHDNHIHVSHMNKSNISISSQPLVLTAATTTSS